MANLGAVRKKSNMRKLSVLTALGQTIVDRLKADVAAFSTIIDTLLNLGVKMTDGMGHSYSP